MRIIFFIFKFVTDYGKEVNNFHVKNKITTFGDCPYFDSKHLYINSNAKCGLFIFIKFVTDYGKESNNFHVKINACIFSFWCKSYLLHRRRGAEPPLALKEIPHIHINASLRCDQKRQRRLLQTTKTTSD